jgi:hypothetical protein
MTAESLFIALVALAGLVYVVLQNGWLSIGIG